MSYIAARNPGSQEVQHCCKKPRLPGSPALLQGTHVFWALGSRSCYSRQHKNIYDTHSDPQTPCCRRLAPIAVHVPSLAPAPVLCAMQCPGQ
eukprot:1034370-Pelagomonas_calceolata.AAC.2